MISYYAEGRLKSNFPRPTFSCLNGDTNPSIKKRYLNCYSIYTLEIHLIKSNYVYA